MLSKLIKHEFRATSRIMWPVFLGMLALTALMRFSQLLLNGGHIPWLLQLIGVLLVIGFVMGLGALGLAPLVSPPSAGATMCSRTRAISR